MPGARAWLLVAFVALVIAGFAIPWCLRRGAPWTESAVDGRMPVLERCVERHAREQRRDGDPEISPLVLRGIVTDYAVAGVRDTAVRRPGTAAW